MIRSGTAENHVLRKSFLALIACSGLASGAVLPSSLWAENTESSIEATEAKKKAKKKSESDTDNNGNMVLDVVVSATGFEQTITDAPASISVISREEIEKGSFHDLTDALRSVQGVAVTGTARGKDIYMRGLPGAYTLILVDGKRQSTRDSRTNGNSGFEQSFIPPAAAIERIEVVRGPMSSLYGSDAMGGVINIITRKVPEKWTGSLTVDGTANEHSRYGNTLQGSYYLAGPLKQDLLGLQLWGRGLGREEDNTYYGTPRKRELDITGRLTLTPNENHDLIFELGRTKLRQYSHIDESIDPDASAAKTAYNYNDRDHISLSYTGRFDWTTLDVSVLREDTKRTNYEWDAKSRRYEQVLRSPQIRNTVVDAKLTTPFAFYGNHTLVTGGQYNEARLTDQNAGISTFDEKFTAEQWAAFAEDEWWLNDKFSLTGGLRLDHHEFYGNHWSPRGYAVWHATDNLTLKGGVSTGFRAPEIRQIVPGYTYPTQKGRGVILSRGNLEPEKSTSYEFSILWDNLDNLQLGATYFYTDFKDKISNKQVLDSAGNPVIWKYGSKSYNLFEYFNIDDAVMQGVELTATWRISENWSLRANYTYTDSEQKTGDYKGLPLARTPEHMANIRLDWDTPVENLDLWVAGTYHGKEINANFREVNSGGKMIYRDGKAIATEYGDYTTFDIGGAYAFNDHAKLNAAIYNLFDKRIAASDFNDVMEGRRFWLSMTTSF